MSTRVLLDTGIITSFYCSGKRDPRLLSLMERIKTKQAKAVVLRTTLVECLSQLCKQPGGMPFAETTMASFVKNYDVLVDDFDGNVAFKAGQLKCQHRKKMSIVDCIAIAYALTNKISFHTTEKDLHEHVPRLDVKTYSF